MDAAARRKRHAWAWAGLSAGFAAHVFDEAWNDFLSVYNPAVTAIRERAPWLPLPVFPFEVWLGLLIAGIAVAVGLTPMAARGKRWMVPLSYFLGVVMVLNGLLHMAGSVWMGTAMPGVYSSPLLLVSAGWLLYSAARAR